MSKTILITGASSGIGRSTAGYFQEQGWNVVATMRNPDKERALTGLPNVLVTRLDVQDPASIRGAIEGAIAKFAKVDVLLNNAGYGAYGPLEATPMEKIRRQFEVNVLGLLETTRAILPHFRRNRSGVIINVSSVGGKMTFPLGTLYHGTKFAVEGLSEALSWEMEPIGVRVKIVEPGAIKTDFAGRSFDFSNDEGMVEYQPLVRKLLGRLTDLMSTAVDPVVVAKVIYEAATDGTSQLRYTAGDDARVLMADRRAADDATFLKGVKERFGLA